MTTTTTLKIMNMPGKKMPTLVAIDKLLVQYGLDDLFETTGADYDRTQWMLQWNDKWESDTAEAFIVEASRKWGAKTWIDIEWNTQDADEPGRERRVYLSGRLVERWDTQFTLVWQENPDA